MCIYIISTASWSPWGTRSNSPFTNEETQSPVFSAWRRYSGCRNLNSARVCRGHRGSGAPSIVAGVMITVTPPLLDI